jgi:hypothetical protein
MKPPKKPSKPLLKSEVRNADGSTTLVFSSGRTIVVPPGVYLWTPPVNFADSVLALAILAYDEFKDQEGVNLPTMLMPVTGERNGQRYRLCCFSLKTRVYWLALSEDDEWVAGGYLEPKEDSRGIYLAEVVAAARPAHRGQRIYPAVIRQLRKQYRLPISSDGTLSTAALLMWMSVGKWDRSSRRYRANPSRAARYPATFKRRAVAAIMLAYSEAATGDVLYAA